MKMKSFQSPRVVQTGRSGQQEVKRMNEECASSRSLGPRQPLHLLFLDNSLIPLSSHVLLWKHRRIIWGPPEYLASLWPILYKKNKIIESNNSLNEIRISTSHSGICLSLSSRADIEDHLNDFPEMKLKSFKYCHRHQGTLVILVSDWC